jgi:beta-N-acetylhexosaminidase
MRRLGILLAAASLAALAVGPGASSRAASGPSLGQLAGQRIVFGFDGTSAPKALIQRIHRGEAGGVILFKRNIRSRSQLRSLTKALQGAVPKGDPPLLVTIDQEGGVVKRLSGAPDHSAAELGRNGSGQFARKEGLATARNLRDVGVNVNLAPVADVGRPGSIMQRQGRSYSGDASRAAKIAVSFSRGLRDGSVGATAKHFPGLGAATKDEDFHVNRIDLSADRLRHTDELPFRKLAADGIPLVMVSTAIYPALDKRPALFSPKIANDELRDRVGFRGASITDDLDTAAAAHYGNAERRAFLAAHAGDDLLLFAQSFSNGERAASELVKAVQSGRLTRKGVERAADRARAVRASLAG